ncbi:MAG: mannose-1-phosphate guanylyltransferase [Anaerolineae bacterium]|nr:mannose-1-phosphate guanylyltransferase [Anaerolineae bacterium]
MYAVILAGGIGTRLWPRSRQATPKQMLDLIRPGTTMLQDTCERIRPLVPPEQVYIVAAEFYRALVHEQLLDMPPRNFLGEPSGRGTAPAIGLAAIHIRQNDPDAVMMVLPADHIVQDVEAYQRALAAAAAHARAGYLVTLGIQPRGPETGYGYIERGRLLPRADGGVAYRVARFVEKPDRPTAERFLASGRFYWNGGIFVCRARDMLAEIERLLPELARALAEVETALASGDAKETIARVWPGVPNITIDYGVMERAEHVAVVPLDAGWSDVGTWSSLSEVLPSDAAGNVVLQGDHVALETFGTVVYSHRPERVIATIGLHDFVIVDTGDALLICPKERAQDVKKVVDILKQHGRSALL